MKNRNIWHRLEDLALDRGFYIVMALCLTAVGISGYFLLDRVLQPMAETPVETQAPIQVTVPDPEPKPAPAVIPKPEEKQTGELPPARETEIVRSPADLLPRPAPSPTPAPAVFTWPVKGELLRGHSLEVLSPDPTMEDWRTHAGVDISARLGERVLCMTRGTVEEILEDDLLGTCVRVSHGEGLTSLYANLSPQPTVKVGQTLNTGDILGAVGQTALAESGMPPHLHLEVFRDGVAADPLELLPGS